MKKVLLISMFLVWAIMAQGENVSMQTAQTAAQSFLNSKTGGNPQIHLIDYAEKAEFPNFYVFGNESCFVIIAADDCVHPVLAYSTESTFETSGMPTNTYGWLKAYNKEIEYIAGCRPEVNPEIQLEWENLLNGRGLDPKSRSSVAPLIRTKWNQKPPVNTLCPADTAGPGGHCVTGCGAIAIAQIMNYWEHPVRGTGSFSYTPTSHPEYGVQSANFGETVYDWDNMRNVYALEYSDVEALAVATLVYHAAVSVRMTFTPNASYTNPSRFKNALTTYFDYSTDIVLREKADYTDAQWISMLKNDLDAQRPIIYRGCDSVSAATAGDEGYAHIFNCDGYDEYNLFHFNWGHKGNYDGYYAIDALYPEHEWNYGNRAIFNCHPNTPSINPPANLNTSVDGQEVTVAWAAVSGAVSYKLYRDDDFVSNVTGCSYVDSNVKYGSHSYTVKSVKSDGIMSLRSNPSVAVVRFPGPRPVNLQASVSGHNVDLSWQTETPESAILQYATVYDSIGGGGTTTQGTRTSWAQRFPVSALQVYAGMAIEKVDFYVRTNKTGEYTVGIYKGDEMNITELVYQQSYNATTSGWHEIVFPSPVTLDYTQDLWIVFYSFVFKPTSMSYYNGSGHYDALLYSNTQSGVLYWQRLSYNRAWMIRTYLTDGTYTYNLYRNGDAIATNLSNITCTDSNLPDGFYDYHVTTNYFGGESDPSNTVSVIVGNPTYTINTSADPNNSGTVTGGGTYNYNQTCTVTATPNTGYTFVNWTENGNPCSNDQTYTFAVTGNRNLVAHFTMQNYVVTAMADPVGGGTVTGAGGYNYGESCTLTATANPGYEFHRWTENGTTVSQNPNFTFIVTESTTYIAHFTAQTYTVTVAVNPTESGTVGGGGTFSYGQTCTVHASANSCYAFEKWTEIGNPVSTNASYTFTVTGNRNLVADFTMLNYIISVDIEPAEGGYVIGSGSHPCGDAVTLEAIANENYSFVGWYENGQGISSHSAMSVVVNSDRHLTALFDFFDGVEEDNGAVNFYPNPASDVLHVKGNGIKFIKVFTSQGQLVESMDCVQQEHVLLNLGRYEAGVYVMEVVTESGVARKQFVKQ